MPLKRGVDTLTVRLIGPSGEVIDIGWHQARCAETDPLHDALADALSLDDGPESDTACRAAYEGLLDQLGERWRDADVRRMVVIRKDIEDVRYTLRGERWGRTSRRRRR